MKQTKKLISKSSFLRSLLLSFLIFSGTEAFSMETPNFDFSILEPQTVYTEPDFRHGALAATIGISSNLLANNIGHMALGLKFLDVSYKSWWQNFSGFHWEFDENTFTMNQMGHPYQGAMYFSAARANGFDFYQSYLFALAGSFMWETTMETSFPSINDIITTPIAGSMVGEVLHRLFLADNYRHTGLTWIINPADGFNYFLTGQRAPGVSAQINSLELRTGSFFTASKAGVGPGAKTYSQSYISLPGVYTAFHADYGNCFESTKTPFESFTLDLQAGAAVKYPAGLDYTTGFGIEGNLMVWELNSSARLKSSMAVTLDYTALYSSTTHYGAIEAGICYFSKLKENSSGWTFNSRAEAGLDILNASDNFYYLYKINDYNERQMRTYDYNSGFFFKLRGNANSSKWGNFSGSLQCNFNFNIPMGNSSSYELKGSEEKHFAQSPAPQTMSFMSLVNLEYSHQIAEKLALGAETDLYIKLGWYKNQDPSVQMAVRPRFFVKYIF